MCENSESSKAAAPPNSSGLHPEVVASVLYRHVQNCLNFFALLSKTLFRKVARKPRRAGKRVHVDGQRRTEHCGRDGGQGREQMSWRSSTNDGY
jgi:hypothetical protein